MSQLLSSKQGLGEQNIAWAAAEFYPGSQENTWDRAITDLSRPGMRVLEIGSGSGVFPQNEIYPLGRVDGVDLDAKVLTNPYLIQGWSCSFYDLGPLVPNKYDLIYSHMVAEHVEDPLGFVQEQLMLLAPGGTIVHSTLSRWSLPALANWLLPRKLQLALLGLLRSKRTPDQVYPAVYKMNSVGSLKRLATTLGLNIQLRLASQPIGYFKFNRRLLGFVSALLAPLERIFPALRCQLLIVITRPN